VIVPHSSLPLGGEKWTIAPGLPPPSVVFAGVWMSSGHATVHVPPPPPVLTVTDALDELLLEFASAVSLETVAVLVITELVAAPVSTCTVSSNCAVVSRGRLAIVQFTVPVLPIFGVVQVKLGPDGWARL
jgi:hypothetical protein